MAITIGFILLGFVFLYFGAEFLISGAEKLAENLNISKAIVGVVVVAFGTSAPELFVNVICACRDETEFALANISGSNLTNLCLGFGLIGMFFGIDYLRDQFKLDIFYFFLGPLIIVLTFLYTDKQYLPLWIVFILIPLILFYLKKAMDRFKDPDNNKEADAKEIVKGVAVFLVGILGLYIGGEVVVHHCKIIGKQYGISDALLGLTIVAGGTSIPDVMASIVAARRGEKEIAIGNLIGSNIFNIFFVLSSTLMFSGINLAADALLFQDYVAVTVLSIFFMLYVSTTKKINLPLGLILVTAYIAYYYLRITQSI